MTQAAPTILALETDSAWIVILAVSLITLPAALVLRRLIARPGGMASGILLTLPLFLPLVAALAYQRAVLPEVAVLQPVKAALERGGGDLLHLLYISDGSGSATAYALIGSAGPWILLVGLSVSSLMLLRRIFGTWVLHRLISRSKPASGPRAPFIHETVQRLTESSGLPRTPEVNYLPDGISGAFAVGARRGRILISEDLVEGLARDELAAILAHEVAHIESRDVQVVFAAGLLRDMVAWNPLAHIAYRRLVANREIEADKRAAAMTGNPLSVASGLLKMYELMKRRPRHGRGTALAFLRPGGRIARRVTHLIDVADGRVGLLHPGRIQYAAAVLLVAALGLQVGATISEDRSALAIVWGSTQSAGEDFAPKSQAQKQARSKKAAKARKKVDANPNQYAPRRSEASKAPTATSMSEQNIDEWVKEVANWARKQGGQAISKQGGQGISPLTLRWEARQDWAARPIRCAVGSICLYRIERAPLVP
jgi:Zn-dependent protease with chaperone function